MANSRIETQLVTENQDTFVEDMPESLRQFLQNSDTSINESLETINNQREFIPLASIPLGEKSPLQQLPDELLLNIIAGFSVHEMHLFSLASKVLYTKLLPERLKILKKFNPTREVLDQQHLLTYSNDFLWLGTERAPLTNIDQIALFTKQEVADPRGKTTILTAWCTTLSGELYFIAYTQREVMQQVDRFSGEVVFKHEGSEDEVVFKPSHKEHFIQRIPNFPKVQKIISNCDVKTETSYSHTAVFVTDTNQIYLAMGSSKIFTRPKLLTELTNIKSIFPNGDFIFFVKEDGKVYAWGIRHHRGDLIESFDEKNLKSLEIEHLPPVKKVIGGKGLIFYLTYSNHVYVNLEDYFNYFFPYQNHNISGFGKIPNLNDVEDVIFQSETESIFFKLKSGIVFSCGFNEKGELGLGHSYKVALPRKIPLSNVKSIASCNQTHHRTYFLTQQGDVFVCGDNFNGSFAIGIETENGIVCQPTRIENLSNIKTIIPYFVGCATFFLNDQGEVYMTELMPELPIKLSTLKNISSLGYLKEKLGLLFFTSDRQINRRICIEDRWVLNPFTPEAPTKLFNSFCNRLTAEKVFERIGSFWSVKSEFNEKEEAFRKKYKFLDDTPASYEKGLRNAAANGYVEDLPRFLLCVENINAQDSNPKSQRTALHWAEIKGYKGFKEALLKAGASTEIPDADGKTPVDYGL